LVEAMLNYLRVAKLEYTIVSDKKKPIKALNQIMEYAARVPELQLLKIVKLWYDSI
jgi:hypothetical protein